MEITDSQDGDVLVIHLNGRFDANTSQSVEDYCRKFIEVDEKKIVLDMANVNHIASAGLRSILALVKDLKAEGGKMYLAALQEIVYEVFDVVGLVTVLKIYKNVDEAVEAF